MKKTNIIKNIAIFALALSLFVISVNATDFSDMPDESHWAHAALQSAVDNNLLSGSDGKLLPFDSLTRAQMATILVRAYGVTEKADISSYTDVPNNAWFYDSMAIAVNSGWFKGDNTGLLNPNKNITRQEVFVVLSRALGASEGESTDKLNTFADASVVPDWAENAVAFMLNNEYIGGSNGYINPKNEITRAEFAQIIYNLVQKGALTLKNSEDETQNTPVEPEVNENENNNEETNDTETLPEDVTDTNEDTENTENTDVENEEIVVVDKPEGGLIIEDASLEDDDEEYVFVFPKL